MRGCNPRHLWRGVLPASPSAAGLSVARAAGRTARDAPVIIGYVFPHGRVLAAGEIDATNLTHVNYAFANVVGGEVVEGSRLDAESLRVLAGLRRVHPDRHIFASVEDERSVRLKARYAREQHLGGVMFWEYFGDPSGRLLAALAKEMRKSERGIPN
jgi:GH18 family chitinase